MFFCLNVLCSMFPKSTHETFAQKLYQTFKSNKRFIKPKLSRTDFTIVHYAGEVIMSSFYSLNCVFFFFFFRASVCLFNLLHAYHRQRIKLISFQTKIKIMSWQSIRIYLMLLNALLWHAYFLHFQWSRQNLPNFLPSDLALR